MTWKTTCQSEFAIMFALHVLYSKRKLSIDLIDVFLMPDLYVYINRIFMNMDHCDELIVYICDHS